MIPEFFAFRDPYVVVNCGRSDTPLSVHYLHILVVTFPVHISPGDRTELVLRPGQDAKKVTEGGGMTRDKSPAEGTQSFY